MARVFIALALLIASVNSENSTTAHDSNLLDMCDALGPWSQALEDWATSVSSGRHGRIMSLSPAKGYYVTERIDTPFLTPPPVPYQQPAGHMSPNQGYIPPNDSYKPQSQGQLPSNQAQLLQKKGHPPPKKSPAHTNAPSPTQSYREWEVASPPGGGKIVNRPPSPYKDKVKPNYAADRVDATGASGGKRVSETDLYLLSAMEQLVRRTDRLDKRLRAVESSLTALLSNPGLRPDGAPALPSAAPSSTLIPTPGPTSGPAAKPTSRPTVRPTSRPTPKPTPGSGSGSAGTPCPARFDRIGEACYSWGDAEDWKRAAFACRAAGAALVEPRTRTQRCALQARLLGDVSLAGLDFWTGGLNPGLLWIWSHSARPVSLDDSNSSSSSNSNSTGADIPGEGRCLALSFDVSRQSYSFRGRDCAAALHYICEAPDEPQPLGNELQRAAKVLRDSLAALKQPGTVRYEKYFL